MALASPLHVFTTPFDESRCSAILFVFVQTPFARDSFLKDEIVDKLNEALTYAIPSLYQMLTCVCLSKFYMCPCLAMHA